MLPEKVDHLVMAACILHNMLTRPKDDQHFLREAAAQQEGLERIADRPNRAGGQAMEVRDKFASYFVSDAGKLPFQDGMV